MPVVCSAGRGRLDRPCQRSSPHIAERYLEELREAKIDTLILGCTHYPLLREVISKVVGPGVELIDSGAETAKQVASDMAMLGILAENGTPGSIRYFVTDSIGSFSKQASRFLESDVCGMVEQVDLE